MRDSQLKENTENLVILEHSCFNNFTASNNSVVLSEWVPPGSYEY